jgi:Zn-dependent protease with chaperone function
MLGFGGLFWSLFGLWVLLQSGFSARFRDSAFRWLARADSRTGPPPFRVVALYFTLFAVFLQLWQLPIGLARLAQEQKYGFARQGVGGYLLDVGQDTAFLLLAIPLVWGGYWLLARSPRNWWKWLWALLVPLIFGVIVLQPVLISPAYNHYTPLAPGTLRTQILALATKAGIQGGHVFVENTSKRTNHVNAYVYGLGPTTRIVINDTALQQLPEDQILAMLGHEMGHYVEGHIWVGFVGAVLGAGIFLGLAARMLPWAVWRGQRRWRLYGMNDPAALPLFYLILSLFLLLQSPVESALSRYLEHRADAFGLRLTHLNAATARLFVGFAERDYSDPDPPWLLQFWFGSHPTLKERIAFALHYPPASPKG